MDSTPRQASSGEVLVIEDTPSSLKLLTELLKQAGYMVRPANDGALGLASARVRAPDLVLLDIRMPGLDGFEVCRQLKADERTREVPVIFLSALQEASEKVQGFRLGAVDYITKPYQAEEVLARVHTHLQLYRLQQKLEEEVRARSASLEKAMAERERLAEEAQRANQAKDQFLAVLSHELRNPLAAIQSGVDLIRRMGLTNPRAAKPLEVVERNAKLQARLVDDLLDLSRIVRGTLSLHPSLVALDSAVASAVAASQARAERAGLALEAQVAPEVWAEVDADRVQQMVGNLLTNAIQATPAGGSVKVSLSSDGAVARIAVEDTGIGLEASRLPTLFRMFGEVGHGARPKAGLGIGLALVKSFAELQNGRVWAESEGPGRGSRFTIELPLAEAPAAHPAEAAKEGPAIRVLLVEDNPDTRALLAENLGLMSYAVTAAESGEQALELLTNQSVDIILADIGLPGIDGYELLRRIHQMPRLARVPAFAVTGFGQESDKRRAREAGYAAHFVKPVDLDNIDRSIRETLYAGQAAQVQ